MAPVCVRHRPERTLLYQIVEEYLPEFRAHLAQKGVTLPDFVEQEFDAYQVLSVPYPPSFLFANRPDAMGRVLVAVHRAIATHLIHKAGFTHKTAACHGWGGSTKERLGRPTSVAMPSRGWRALVEHLVEELP